MSLALAVGANTAVFSIVDALWLRPLPVLDPGRVIVAYQPVVSSADGAVTDAFQRRHQARLQELPAFSGMTFELQTAGNMGDWKPLVRLRDGRELRVRAVEHSYFEVLGVPVQGRMFGTADDAFGAPAMAIVSRRFLHEVLRDQTGPGLILPTTTEAVTIVGVVDSAFEGPRLGERTDIWIPLGALGRFSDVASSPGIEPLMPLTVLARLRPGMSLRAAQEEVRSVLASDVALQPLKAVAFPLHSYGDQARQQTLVRSLTIIALLVLLLGSANLASLFLLRSESRRQAFALRFSLGASRREVMGLVLAEIALLGGLGFAMGLVLQDVLLRLIRSFALPSGLVIDSLQLSPNWRVVLFATIVTVIAMSVAIVTALRQTVQLNLTGRLATVGRSMTSRTLRLRQVLLAGHVSICVVLLTLAASVMSSLFELANKGVGFDADKTVFLRVRPRLAQYVDATRHEDPARRLDDYFRLLDRVKSLPGIVSATYGPQLLTSAEDSASSSLIVVNNHSWQLPIAFRAAGPGYLSTLGASFVMGRDLDETDRAQAFDIRAAFAARRMGQPAAGPASHAVIDTTLAQTLWPDANPVGQVFAYGGLATPYEVVGLIRPVRHAVLSAHPTSTIVSYDRITNDSGTASFDLVIHLSGQPDRASEQIRGIVEEMFPDPAFLSIQSGAAILAVRTARERLTMSLLSWYALVSSALALVGIFGLVSHFVAAHQRELAVRTALGAQDRALRRFVMLRGLGPVAAGLAAGVALSVAVTRVVEASIPGLSPAHVTAYATSGMLVLVGAIVATRLGTRSLGRINVSSALAAE